MGPKLVPGDGRIPPALREYLLICHIVHLVGEEGAGADPRGQPACRCGLRHSLDRLDAGNDCQKTKESKFKLHLQELCGSHVIHKP